MVWKMFTNVLFKLHAGENRYLERLWLLATQFGSQTSSISYHLGACRKYRLLGPALRSLNQNQPLSKIPPVIQTGPEAFCLRLSDLSLDPGRSTTIASLFPRNLHMLVWKSFTFHQDYKKYLYIVPMPFFSPFYKVMKVKVAQSCPTLCDPRDYTVHGILQARILEWVAFPFSRGSSQPRDRTQVSRITGGFFTSWPTREAQEYWSG